MKTSFRVFMAVTGMGLTGLFAVSAVGAGEPPQDGAYPGRCPVREGRTVPGEETTLFSCAGIQDGFKVDNYGPNAIVRVPPHPMELYPSRSYWFNFPGRHRQEISLLIVEHTREDASDMRLSKIYLLPRKVLPELRTLGDLQEITLSTGETVTLNRLTHELKSGALQEKPMDLAGYEANPDLFADVSYHGTGVQVRIDRRGPASFHLGHALITKHREGKVTQECRVPSREVLMDTTTEFRFATDEEFSAYLQAKCGFGL